MTTLQRLVWDDRYRIGSDTIDTQHCRLFELGALLVDSAEADCPPSVVDDAVRALYGYIRVHFREEEELMEGIGDPNIEKHRQAHDRFILAFDDLIADHRGDSDFAKQLALFVAEWLVAHIQGMDLTIRSG